MKRNHRLLLILALAGVMLPMGAHAASGNQSIPAVETAAAPQSKAPEAGTLAGQMQEYYLNETGPQGNTFCASGASAIALPETDAAGACRLLEVPLYRQSHNFTCGVACVASVLRYAGYDFDTREDRLLWELAATPENGTNYMTIAGYLNSVRVEGYPDTPVFSTEIVCTAYTPDEQALTPSNLLLKQLRAALDDGAPVICVIQAWKDDGDYTTGAEDDGHYVVLVGYKKDVQRDTYIYYFMDPSTSGSYTYLTEEEFILRWHDSLEGTPTRIAIAVSYLNGEQSAPIHAAYHLD